MATAFAAVSTAGAAVISSTQTFVIPATLNSNATFGVTGGTFADFNPALGTLTGVSLTFAGAAEINLVFPPGDTTDTTDELQISRVGTGFGDLGFGRFTGTVITTGANPFDFSVFGTGTTGATAYFSQPGSTELDFALQTPPIGGASGTATLTSVGTISETLTYTYTPAVAASTGVPEPGLLALLGLGAVSLLAARRGRRS